MKVQTVTDAIEAFAPLAWQESYDNAGLIVGRPDDEVHAALLAVDVTEAVLDEAEATGCDMVITHHPIDADSGGEFARLTCQDFKLSLTLINRGAT